MSPGPEPGRPAPGGPAQRTGVARRIIGTALDVLFPPKCVGCGGFGAFICERCLETTPRAAGNRCPRCWAAIQEGWCQDCAGYTPAFTSLRSAFGYGGVARNAVLSLKFEGVSALAPRMASLMADALTDWSPSIDTIVPVPLGWLRSRTRGYNQAELLAGDIARTVDLPFERHALRRVRRTAPQTRQADAASRRENVRGAFAPGSRPASGRVLLIDDVATTGATLDACAQALLEGGATTVYALTFARED